MNAKLMGSKWSRLAVAGAAVLALTRADAAGVDWYRWRGPDLNGISRETGWNANWPKDGPRKLWQAQIGVGFSSFAVSEGRVFTTGNADGKDTLFCFAADTGKVLWQHSYAHPLDDKYYEGGTSATPTVDGQAVYSLSKRGHLFCLNAADGKVVWSKNLAEETGAKVPTWGFASSPLVQDQLLVVNVGTAGMALDKATGKVVWQTGADAAGYASAVPFVEDGRKRLAIFGAQFLFAVALEDGKEAWRHAWKTSYEVNAADPIIKGSTVFLSSSYGTGCALIEFANGQTKELWRNKQMRNHFNSCVLLDGHLYGTTGQSGQASHLMCLEWNTGAVKWTERSVGLGALMAADGKLIVQAEKGELMIVKAQPSGFEAISRAQVLGGKCWTTPVLSQGRIYSRNAAGNMVCLDVRK